MKRKRKKQNRGEGCPRRTVLFHIGNCVPYMKDLSEDAQLAERKVLLCSPLAREEFADELFAL